MAGPSAHVLMDKERFIYLLNVYQTQKATPEERKEFAGFLHDERYEPMLAQVLDGHWNALTREETDQATMPGYDRILREITLLPQKSARKMSWWPRITIAAAVILLVFSAGLYLYQSAPHTQTTAHVFKNDIAPGKVGATLTLANGKKIKLSDATNGEIAMEAGIVISKTANGQLVYEIKSAAAGKNQINTLTTEKGETYRVILPDQSKVWLNAASRLTYNTTLLNGGVRSVKLSGEAYFEVAKDAAHPFIVESGTQQIEVLGTHFNVNAYDNERVSRTTLLEGRVKVSDHGQTKLLEPGYQAVNPGNDIRLSPVDTDLAVAWKDNNFIFDRLDIKEIMRSVERWYNVEVIYMEEITAGKLWGSVSRFDNVSKVLIALEATGQVHFKIEGRKIYVFN